jgi:hypothetical protein
MAGAAEDEPVILTRRGEVMGASVQRASRPFVCQESQPSSHHVVQEDSRHLVFKDGRRICLTHALSRLLVAFRDVKRGGTGGPQTTR